MRAGGCALLVLAAFACNDDGEHRSAPEGDAGLEALGTLGYVDFSPVPSEHLGKSGVVRHRPELASPGFSLYNTRSANRAVLVDMAGDEVHAWYNPELDGTWHHVEMAPSGDLFVLDRHSYLARLDWGSNLVWRRELDAHHDVELGRQGRIYVLDREPTTGPLHWAHVRLVDDAITELDATDGATLRRFFFSELLRGQTGNRFLWAWKARLQGRRFDAFHVNSIELVDRDLGGLPTAGTFLVCARQLDLVAFIDVDRGVPVWTWGRDALDAPHQPSVMANGHILVFDNGTRRGWSRVIEVDPAAGEIVWEYRGDPPESFYTAQRGGAQELANGNILVTDSDDGRGFEITRDGEVVWEFFNPDLTTGVEGQTARGAIYRMTRIDAAVVTPLLARR